jgi:hypothetical protein
MENSNQKPMGKMISRSLTPRERFDQVKSGSMPKSSGTPYRTRQSLVQKVSNTRLAPNFSNNSFGDEEENSPEESYLNGNEQQSSYSFDGRAYPSLMLEGKPFQKRNQLEGGSIFLMIGVAMFFDAIQIGLTFIPFIGWILSSLLNIFAWLTFYVWTSIKGWGLADTAKSTLIKWAKKSKWLVPLIEIFPIVNAVPAWTFSALLQLAILKADDAAYNASRGRIDMKVVQTLTKKHQKIMAEAA